MLFYGKDVHALRTVLLLLRLPQRVSVPGFSPVYAWIREYYRVQSLLPRAVIITGASLFRGVINLNGVINLSAVSLISAESNLSLF